MTFRWATAARASRSCRLEAGGYSLDGEMITADTTAMAANGATYGVGRDADGNPAAVYRPSSVTVMLGMD